MLARGGSEIAHLVEDVIGGQQHLRLDELDASLAQQSGGVHHLFAGISIGRSDRPADYGNALGLGGNPLDGRAITRNKRRPLDQIARRVPGDSELREHNQTGACASRLERKLNNLGGVAREIAHGGVDLAKGNLHASSVEGRRVEAIESWNH